MHPLPVPVKVVRRVRGQVCLVLAPVVPVKTAQQEHGRLMSRLLRLILAKIVWLALGRLS